MRSLYRGSEDNGGLPLQRVQQSQQEQGLLNSSAHQLELCQLLGQLVPVSQQPDLVLMTGEPLQAVEACYDSQAVQQLQGKIGRLWQS